MLRLWKSREKEPAFNLHEVLGKADIPSFPAAMLEVLSVIRDPANSMGLVAEHVGADPKLVVRLLGMVNSAAFGLGRTISSIHHACSMVGRSRLEALVLSLAVQDSIPAVHHVDGFEPHRFWLAAFRRAGAAGVLASHLHPTTQGESFTAGLLQDMALPLLARAHGAKYGDVLEEWHSDPALDLEMAEQGHFGWCHTRVGATLASEWEFPAYLVDAVGYHHHRNESTRKTGVEPAIRLVSYIRESDENLGLGALVADCQERFGLEARSLARELDDAVGRADEFSCLLS